MEIIPDDFKAYITFDKFCAGFENGITKSTKACVKQFQICQRVLVLLYNYQFVIKI